MLDLDFFFPLIYNNGHYWFNVDLVYWEIAQRWWQKRPQKCSYYLVSHYRLFTFSCIPDLEKERIPTIKWKSFLPELERSGNYELSLETISSKRATGHHICTISKVEAQIIIWISRILSKMKPLLKVKGLYAEIKAMNYG